MTQYAAQQQQATQDDEGDPFIRQPDVKLNRDAIRDWLWRRQPAQVLTVRRTCAFCEQPAATAEWRPTHPGWMRLCARHRSLIYDLARLTAERTGGEIGCVLDNIMRALCLVEYD